ncbi:DUF1828 domain-containing protein [Aquabacterium sp.]|uniref:DUF1828 domain-containing protein n=1 Tax=Aquabacterium sp. TaxID=1872578 RepID=UPI0024879B37|nr:DUF1828 domain-containing protein [Aquabacterium sp.]MDI1258189.1 DUF1828 domain-containing protein [Aquabacterium sp.]
MTVNTQELQKSLCALMCADVKLVKKGDRLMIRTPFSFPDGDPYIIYLSELSNGFIKLSDAGHTMMHLSYENDVDKFRQGTRGKIFDQILTQHGIFDSHGELFVETMPGKIGSAIFKFGQAINSITDLTFLNRTRTESTFYEDLAEIISGIVDGGQLTRDFIYPNMENAADYPIDFKIDGKADPLFIFGIPSKDKARLATIVIERLLRARAVFDSMLIFSDQSQIPRPDLARLSNAGGEMIASLDAQDDIRRKIGRRVNF